MGRSWRIQVGRELGGVKEGRGEFDFTCPLLSDFRGIVVESAAALSRSALQTQGSGYCAARWGRPLKIKTEQSTNISKFIYKLIHMLFVCVTNHI